MEELVFVFITFCIICVRIRYHKYLTYLADSLKLLVKDNAIFCTYRYNSFRLLSGHLPTSCCVGTRRSTVF